MSHRGTGVRRVVSVIVDGRGENADEWIWCSTDLGVDI